MSRIRLPGEQYASESSLSNLCVSALDASPYVTLVKRVNSGTFRVGSRRIKGAPNGWSDVDGMLCDGRAFYIENKLGDAELDPDQEEFRAKVIAGNGLHGVARTVSEALALIEMWRKERCQPRKNQGRNQTRSALPKGASGQRRRCLRDGG